MSVTPALAVLWVLSLGDVRGEKQGTLNWQPDLALGGSSVGKNTISLQPVPDGKCGDGTQAWVVVITPEEDLYPDKFFVEFQGGSVCMNHATCEAHGLKRWMGLEWMLLNIVGIGSEALDAFKTGLAFEFDAPGTGLCDMVDGFCAGGLASWPYGRDHPMYGRRGVFMTLCNADMNIGRQTCNYTDNGRSDNPPAYHHGGINVAKVLEIIRHDFPGLTDIAIFGGSGGAVSAQIWAPRVADMWANASINVLADSGFHILPAMDLWSWFYENACWSSGEAGTVEGNPRVVERLGDEYDIPDFDWSSPDVIVDLINEYQGRIKIGFFQCIADNNVDIHRNNWLENTPEFEDSIPADITMEEQAAGIWSFLNNLHARVPPGSVASYIADGTCHHETAKGFDMDGELGNPGMISIHSFFYNFLLNNGVGCCEEDTTQKLWYTDLSVCRIGETPPPTPALPDCVDNVDSIAFIVGQLAPGASCWDLQPLCELGEVDAGGGVMLDVGATLAAACCQTCHCSDDDAGMAALAQAALGMTISGCGDVQGLCGDPSYGETVQGYCCYTCTRQSPGVCSDADAMISVAGGLGFFGSDFPGTSCLDVVALCSEGTVNHWCCETCSALGGPSPSPSQACVDLVPDGQTQWLPPSLASVALVSNHSVAGCPDLAFACFDEFVQSACCATCSAQEACLDNESVMLAALSMFAPDMVTNVTGCNAALDYCQDQDHEYLGDIVRLFCCDSCATNTRRLGAPTAAAGALALPPDSRQLKAATAAQRRAALSDASARRLFAVTGADLCPIQVQVQPSPASCEDDISKLTAGPDATVNQLLGILLASAPGSTCYDLKPLCDLGPQTINLGGELVLPIGDIVSGACCATCGGMAAEPGCEDNDDFIRLGSSFRLVPGMPTGITGCADLPEGSCASAEIAHWCCGWCGAAGVKLQSPAPTPLPPGATLAPSPAPTRMAPVVRVVTTVQGVDYDTLTSDRQAYDAFEAGMKEAFAEVAGDDVGPDMVDVVVEAGSVAVTASIAVPGGGSEQEMVDAAQSIQQSVQAANVDAVIVQKITEASTSVPALASAVQVEQLAATSEVTVVTAPPTAAPTASPSGGASTSPADGGGEDTELSVAPAPGVVGGLLGSALLSVCLF